MRDNEAVAGHYQVAGLAAWLRLIRVRQWVKNAFVAAPLFFSPPAVTGDNVLRIAVGVLLFALMSSAVYIVNDVCDRKADALHPTKRHRPLASGAISPMSAVTVAVLLGTLALAGALGLSMGFALYLAVYLALNLGYSLKLRSVSILDLLIISLGFVIRVKAGCELTQVVPGVWIIVCTGLLSLFLAVAKRRDDLVSDQDEEHRKSLSGYNLAFLDTCLTITSGSLIVSYSIYTADLQAIEHLGTRDLYLTIPFVIAAVLRYLQITLVEHRSGSPTDVVLSDRFIISCVAGWVLTLGVLIYG